MRRMSLLVVVLPACATYEGPRFDGVSSGRASSSESLEIHLVWQVEAAENFVGSTKTEVSGDLLGEWTASPRNDPPGVAIYNASPYLDVDGPKTRQDFALAYVEAVVPGTVFDTIVGFDGRNIRAIDETHLVAWVPEDVDGATPLGQLIGGSVTAGYHVLDVTRLEGDAQRACDDAREAQWDACDSVDLQEYDTCIYAIDPSWTCYPTQLSLAPADLDTELSLRFADVETLWFPSWP